MIKVESNYNAQAVSSKGAQGLMQLMPSTAKMLGVRDSFDPQENIEGGVKYLKYLQSLYKDPTAGAGGLQRGSRRGGKVQTDSALPGNAELREAGGQAI